MASTSGAGAGPDEDYKSLGTGKLKRLLVSEGVDCSDCIERSDLLEKAQSLKRRKREVEERKWGSSPGRPYELMCTPAHPQGRKLQDLCSGRFRAAFVSSMLVDPDWFCDNFPDLVKCGELVVAHGLDRDQGATIENRLKASRAKFRKTEGRLIVHRPPLPIPYGTHHSKFFILFHEDGFLRLIIHTANLSDENVNWKTQGVWWQDFRFKSGDPEGTCKFERDLVDYLKRVLPKQENSILENVRKVDFSSAEALGLVASVPGYHKGADRDDFGHMKVRSLLEKEEFGSCFAGSPLIYQFSSLGSLDEKWLKEEFTKRFEPDPHSLFLFLFSSHHIPSPTIPYRLSLSLCGHLTIVSLHSISFRFLCESFASGIEASTGKALGSPRDLQEDLCLIWPTMAEVTNSLEGIRAGDAIPGPVKNVDKPFLQKHYRR